MKRTLSPVADSSFFIASARYLGPMFWGGLILYLSSRMSKDRYISLAIGIVALILEYFVIKTGEWFGIVFTFGFALFMILAFYFLKDIFHDYLLKFIGLTSLLYVVIDIKTISLSEAELEAMQTG